jgi:hypothetical protein
VAEADQYVNASVQFLESLLTVLAEKRWLMIFDNAGMFCRSIPLDIVTDNL